MVFLALNGTCCIAALVHGAMPRPFVSSWPTCPVVESPLITNPSNSAVSITLDLTCVVKGEVTAKRGDPFYVLLHSCTTHRAGNKPRLE